MRITGTDLFVPDLYQVIFSEDFHIVEKTPCPIGMDAGDMVVDYCYGILRHKEEGFFVKYKIRIGLLHKFNFVVYTTKGKELSSVKEHAALLLKNMENQAQHVDLKK